MKKNNIKPMEEYLALILIFGLISTIAFAKCVEVARELLPLSALFGS